MKNKTDLELFSWLTYLNSKVEKTSIDPANYYSSEDIDKLIRERNYLKRKIKSQRGKL